MALGYTLIVGLCIGLITPIAQAEAPTDTLYPAAKTSQVVDGLTEQQRADQIDAFFTVRGNLPLAGYGLTFVQAADKYGVDWRLVPAIAYNESTAGLHECPGKHGTPSYNAFGYTGCNTAFSSYDVAIDTVTRDVAGQIPSTSKYFSGKSINQIIDAYNPPSANEDYLKDVKWTMNKIATTDTSVLVATNSASSQLAIK